MRRKEVIALSEGISLEKIREVADNRRSIEMLLAGFGEMISLLMTFYKQLSVKQIRFVYRFLKDWLMLICHLINTDSLKLNNNRQRLKK